MATKKKGLGRGLNALLGGNESVEAMTMVQNEDELREIGIDLIRRGPWQPRTHFDEAALNELADSIRSQGVVQPIVVRASVDNSFEIVAGERRWRAAQIAGLQQVPAVIKHFDDQTAAAVSLIENIQRENLNPLEESVALQRLIDEFGMTHQQVADTVARSRTAVTNLLRLQDLNADVKELLETRAIEMGHARALLGVTGAVQSQLAKETAKKGLSVRETEQLVRRTLNPPKKAKPVSKDPDIKKLETDLSEKLGAAVNIHQKSSSKGRLEINDCNSLGHKTWYLFEGHNLPHYVGALPCPCPRSDALACLNIRHENREKGNAWSWIKMWQRPIWIRETSQTMASKCVKVVRSEYAPAAKAECTPGLDRHSAACDWQPGCLGRGDNRQRRRLAGANGQRQPPVTHAVRLRSGDPHEYAQ